MLLKLDTSNRVRGEKDFQKHERLQDSEVNIHSKMTIADEKRLTVPCL